MPALFVIQKVIYKLSAVCDSEEFFINFDIFDYEEHLFVILESNTDFFFLQYVIPNNIKRIIKYSNTELCIIQIFVLKLKLLAI